MPRKAAPKGAQEIKQSLFRIADNVGNSKRGLARELGISYYQANKIITAKKEKTPLYQWIGEKGDPRAYGRVVKLERAVEESRWREAEQRREGKRELANIPLEAPIGAPDAQPFKSKDFKNGLRESYRVDSSKRIKIPSGAYVQILAKGKGKSKGKEIKKLASSAAGDLASAWASFNRYRNQTGFVSSSIEIVITSFK